MFQTFDALPYPFKPVVDDFASEPFLPREPVEIIESVRAALFVFTDSSFT